MFNKMKKMKEAIRQNDAGQVKKIINRKKYAEACTLAVASEAPGALEALLKSGKGFYFTSDGDYHNRQAARKLVDAAFLSSNVIPLLSVLYEANKATESGKLDTEDFLTLDTPIELLQKILKENPKNYHWGIRTASMHSTETLKAVLAFTSSVAGAQNTLDTALVQVVQIRNVERAKMLLEHDANPDYNGGQALLYAAEKGDQEMVDLLLPLTKPGFRRIIAAKLQMIPDMDTALIASLDPADTQKPAAAPQQAEGTEDGFRREDDDTLSRKQTMADGTCVRTLFNFLAKLQLSIVETPGCSTPGVNTTPFAQLEDGVVEEMEKIHAALGEKEKPAVARPSTRLRVLQ